MSLTEHDLAKRSGDRVEIRFDPLRLRFRFAGLGCSDSHLLRITFSCSVQAIDNPIERRALQEAFLSTRPLVTADDLIEHFQPAFRSAVSRIASTRSAAEWMDSPDYNDLIQALRKAAKPIEFDSG